MSVAWFAMANTVQAQSDLILECGQQYDRDHGITIFMQQTQNKFWKIRSVKGAGKFFQNNDFIVIISHT